MSIKSVSKTLTAGLCVQPETPVAASDDTVQEKQLLSAQELLDQVLDNVISYDQLLILTKKGQIPFVFLGERRFYRRQTILDWLNQQEEESLKKSSDKAGQKSSNVRFAIVKGGKIA